MAGKVVPVAGLNDRVAEFVMEHVPECRRGWGNFTSIAFMLGDELIAGTVYHSYDPDWGVIQMDSASISPRWLTRETLHSIFYFPFVQLSCRNVVMRVSSLNPRMCSIAERFGFTKHVLPNLRAEGEDDVVYLLSREAWEKGRFHG